VIDRHFSSVEVAERVGCSSRGACEIIKSVTHLRLGNGSELLRVSELELNAWLARMAGAQPLAERVPGDLVYFIAAIGGVKIGHTRDVAHRIDMLQKANPGRLVLQGLFAGGAAAEAYYHGRFRQKLIHGEWFDLTSDDLALVGLRRAAA
jgi:hypothetical protein